MKSQLRKIDTFLNADHPAATLDAAICDFLNSRRYDISPYSVIHLFASLHSMSEALGNPAVDTLTRIALRQYVDGLYLQYSEGTIRSVVGDIKQLCRWMKRHQYTDKNLGKRLKKPARRRGKIKATTDQNIKLVANQLTCHLRPIVGRDLFGNLLLAPLSKWDYQQRQAARDLFVLLFLYETGARAGEMAMLGANAMATALAGGGPAHCITCIGKTQSEYWFTSATVEAWRIWQYARPKGLENYAVIGWRQRQSPEPLTTNGISHMLVRRCHESHVVPPFRAHALRHSKIQRTRRMVGLETACILIDHANPATTFGYANVALDEITEAVIKTGWQSPLF